MYGICTGNMDESFDNPLKFQYLILFNITYSRSNYYLYIMYGSLKGMWKDT